MFRFLLCYSRSRDQREIRRWKCTKTAEACLHAEACLGGPGAEVSAGMGTVSRGGVLVLYTMQSTQNQSEEESRKRVKVGKAGKVGKVPCSVQISLGARCGSALPPFVYGPGRRTRNVRA